MPDELSRYQKHCAKVCEWCAKDIPMCYRGHSHAGRSFHQEPNLNFDKQWEGHLECAAPKLSDWAESESRRADALQQERDQLKALLNTPEIEDFDKAVPLEAAHQVQRWTAAHDAGKNPEDWFWLVGYLAGKALSSLKAGNIEKAKHHCVSTASALRNWHAHIRSGSSVMRPGLSEEATSGVVLGGEKAR